MTKERKQLIKERLRSLNSNKELILVYDELISRYKEIEKLEPLEEWQEKELKEWQEFRLDLYKKVDALEIGINLLNYKENDKIREVIEKTYIDGKLRTAIAYDIGYSEDRIKQLLELGYQRLDSFVI